jgi:hypothetical protein
VHAWRVAEEGMIWRNAKVRIKDRLTRCVSLLANRWRTEIANSSVFKSGVTVSGCHPPCANENRGIFLPAQLPCCADECLVTEEEGKGQEETTVDRLAVVICRSKWR